MAASVSYVPEPHEQAYYLGLFRAADVEGTGNIGGAQAVQFFARSKLPVEVLKNIWTVADQPSTSSLDHKKFAVAVRLIQLTQNGLKGVGPRLFTPPDVQQLRPVFFEGMQIPNNAPNQQQQQQQQQQRPPPQEQQQATPRQPQRTMSPPRPTPTGNRSPQQQRQMQPSMQQHPQQHPQQPPTSPSRALVGMDPYSMSPQERSRYESLFPQYAKTEDDSIGLSFVYGSEAVPLFMKSGVDATTLRNIWNMVDRNPVDNRLDKLEFALAMHLIVCTSKKNLPIPSGGALPNSLRALKVTAAAAASDSPRRESIPITQVVPPLQQQQQQHQMPPPQYQQQQLESVPETSMGNAGGAPPLGGSGGMGGMSISSAFEGLSIGNNNNEPPVSSNRVSSLPSYVPEQEHEPERPQPSTPQQKTQPSYVHQQHDPVMSENPQPVYNNMTPSVVVAPPLSASGAPATALSSKPSLSSSSYEVGDTQQELEKLKNVLQKLQAENISLKAQLGNMTDEEKEVQKSLGATITEIGNLSADLGLQRQHVLEAKNRLLEAKAELKAQKDTKNVLTELIGESEQTKSAIEDATEMIRNANQVVANTTNMTPAPTTEIQNNNVVESNDFFGASMTQFNQGQEREISPTPQSQRPSMEVGMQGGGGGGGDTGANLPSPTSRNSTYSAHGTPSPSQYSIPETGFAGASPMPDGTNNNGTAFAPSSTEHYPSSMMNAHYAAPPPASYPDPQQNYGALPPPEASYPDPQQNYGALPPPASYPDPQQNYGAPPPASNSQVPQQQQQQLSPNIDRPSALATHGRQLSGFESGFMMGGSAAVIEHQEEPDISADPEEQQQLETFEETFSVAARSHASSGEYGYDDQAFEIVEGMKKKAKQADKNARDNEAASRKLAADAEELRNDADKTEANARSLKAAAEEKKKGRFGGGKKKKLQDSAEQANKDAADIKKRFMAVQTEAYEAATLAATTRSVADRLRDEAESAELQMVSAASAQQQQKPPAPAPVPTANNTFVTNGGYGMPSPKPNYEGMAPIKQHPSPSPHGQGMQMQMMMPSPSPANGGYNNYGQQPYGGGQPAAMQPPSPSGASGFAPMGGGGGGENFTGYDLPDPSTFQQSAPAPGMQPAADPYANPF